MKEKKKKIDEFLNKYTMISHIPLSLGMIFVLEWMSRHSFLGACSFVGHYFGAFLFNCYLVFVSFTLVFLSKKRTFVRMFICAIYVMLGVINCIVLFNRVSPFGFTDLNMVTDLLTMQNTNYFSAAQGAMSVAAILAYAVFLVYIFRKEPDKEYKTKLWVRLVLIIAAFATVPLFTIVARKADIVSSYYGNLAQGYAENGYIYSFASSVFDRGMKIPDNYKQAHVDEILEETDMGESTIDKDHMPNIVLILLESFYDVSECNFIKTSEDATPFFHELEKNYSTGHFIAPVVGAGTCNSEFEVLTGMSVIFFGPGEYPQKTVLKEVDRCESFAHVLHDLGYGTHVVHNNGGNFYSRKNAFSLMGFDTFQSKEMLDITDYNPLKSWPLDHILIGASSDAMDTTEGPDFLYTITVQTHGDYPKYKVIEDPEIKVECEGKDEETRCMWEYYINMLHGEDEFIRDYIKMFDERGEDTLVIMFGDHLPTIGIEEDETATKNLYLTKYATWNNFGMKKEDADLAAYQLMPVFLDRLGIHGGNFLDYDQKKTREGLDPSSSEYMEDLELLQYDLLYGKRLMYHGEDKYPASDIEMGVQDVTIDKIFRFNNQLHIYGKNFTKWSKVYVNGEKVSTTYESGQVLSIDEDSVQSGDEISVCQMGSSNTIFRESNKIVWFGE